MTNIPETGRTSRITIRLVVIQILVFSLLLTLGGRLWFLQIRQGDEFAAEAAGNHVQQAVQPAVRGSILDARGVPIADNETRLVVSADRTELSRLPDDGERVLADLAELLDIPVEDVTHQVRLCDAETPQPCWNGSPYQPIPITDEATTQQALQIRERAEDFPGISAELTAVRRYPSPDGANTAQVLGYLSPVTDEEVEQTEETDAPLLRSDQIGRSGLERSYDSYLRGDAGVTRYEVDKFGRVLGESESEEAEAGSNLVTSIDTRVQAVVESELIGAMEAARATHDPISGRNFEADAGSAVVLENDTGRVVAMASAPDYDPNVWVGGIATDDYAALTDEDANDPLLNRAIQGQGPPGSTFKVVTSTAAVNAGFDFDGGYNCPSSYEVGGQVFRNFESQAYGSITLGDALRVSCNTVFYGIAHREWRADGGIDPKENPDDWLFRTAHDFGLGEQTGIDLPNEAPGRIPDRQWKQEYWELNRDNWCEIAETDRDDYEARIARENCTEGMQMRAGDMLNFSIGQGDVLVTPLQLASVYAALGNGGTIYTPQVGRAVISADGREVEEFAPAEAGRLPADDGTVENLRNATASVITSGSADWKFGGWPQNEITLRGKTGTAEASGDQQTTSWLATYTDDYTVVMTINQAGTGSGASGDAVRRIWEAMYGVSGGSVNEDAALLSEPHRDLPVIDETGAIVPQLGDEEDEDRGEGEEGREEGEDEGTQPETQLEEEVAPPFDEEERDEQRREREQRDREARPTMPPPPPPTPERSDEQEERAEREEEGGGNDPPDPGGTEQEGRREPLDE
ncbi:penicillin-binding protein 2 [Streptomyces radicis]|uniref:Penicillin-binding protein 2 n=1 Tax=Streptomyces radicis TaxID=1750517 RepID=A0A3A9WDH8_9ACTN|nr:penicillin-binding protein 2 [Streptomyces radicis]RKN11035.1 penicillin-binding protein 2 [Streptomyces radicis]RKN25298.1 penicillin-binding protein 2 [Streptomyces radicis]